MMTIVRKPWFYLVVQAIALFLAFTAWDKYQLAKDEKGLPEDRDGYVVASKIEWTPIDENMLIFLFGGYSKPLGYFLFLKGVLRISPSLEMLPLCHLAVHLLAVFAFYGGLRCAGMGGWFSLVAASTLIYSNTMINFVTTALAECLPASLAIFSIGMLLIVVSRPRNGLAWLGLTVAVLLSYHIHPSYVVMVVLVPPLGFILMGLVVPRPQWLRQRMRVGAGLLGACVVPLLAFCVFRWVVVGHFGVVSAEGFNIAGIAGQFLTEDLVADLPADVQPLAQAVVEKRKREEFAHLIPPLDSDNHLLSGAVEKQVKDGGGIFGETTWRLYYLTVMEVENIGEETLVINNRMRRISLAIIEARPMPYIAWLGQSCQLAVINAFTVNHLLNWLVLLLVLMLIVWTVIYVVMRLRVDAPVLAARATTVNFSIELCIMVVIAFSYLLSRLVLIVLVELPIPRYMDSANVFLPTVAVTALFVMGRQITALVTPAQLK